MKKWLIYLKLDEMGRFIVFACFIIFILLLFKDPFSERNLISNLEPYPDTIHYIAPARSLASGDEFLVKREGRELIPSVKPLYSLLLVPGYIINKDARIFYFTNFILAILSAFLFLLILRKISKNIWINGFVFFLYISNYFIYWFPVLAMAENLILPLFLASVWLLLDKTSIRNSFLIGLLSFTFYAAKSASAPLTASLLAVYGIKILIHKAKFIKKVKMYLALGFGLSLILIPSMIYDSSLGRDNILTYLFSLASSGSPIPSDRITATSSAWFSISYINKHLPQYFNALFGEQIRFLWDFTPIVPKFVGFGAILGLLISLFTKNMKFFSFSLITLLFTPIIFIASFYSVDARYIYHAIPVLLIGFSIFLVYLFNFLESSNKKSLSYVILGGLFLFYFFFSALRLKNQIMLNLKYAETPWSYISVLRLNEYFTRDKIKNDKKPIVITPMPAYFIDFYSNGNYTLLPLSLGQEFRQRENTVWGPYDYTDLIKLYKNRLDKSFEVYVAIYGLGNEGYLHNDFNKIKENFNLALVYPGCYDLCNIYKVNLKK